MLLVHLLRPFLQKDRKTSMQRAIISTKKSHSNHDVLKENYNRLVLVADRIKYKRGLSLTDAKFAATYYKSIQNELDGKTLRFNQSELDQK